MLTKSLEALEFQSIQKQHRTDPSYSQKAGNQEAAGVTASS